LQPLDILKKYWGYNQFRPNQEAIINSVLSGNHTLALLPTGGGKSICFQVPALVMNGICIVVSPLIALMKDQVENLQKKGIKAYAIYSGMNYREIQTIINNCINGDVKFLYLSPERLLGLNLRSQLQLMNICLVAIDEAHCISQWGHDFRPEYRKISEILELLPNIPVLALTASATTKVASDIQTQLGFKKQNVFRNSFERTNLHYIVRHTEQKFDKIIDALQKTEGSALVYVRSRRKTEDVAYMLQQLGIKAEFYHAGLNYLTRVSKQEDWIKNRVRVMVCTNAFGMGIDKPDCRLVIHYEMPDSLEAYYQEAGRAGRDGKRAYCLLLYNHTDKINLQERIDSNFPPETDIRQVYQALCNYYQIPVGKENQRSLVFDLDDFCKKYKLVKAKTMAAIKVLAQIELIHLSETFFEQSKVKILADHETLYRFQVDNAKYDSIIKILLRSYGGLFDNYVTLNEGFLAKKLNLSLDAFKSALNNLTKLQVLDYIPQAEAAQITFITERVEANYISFEKSNLKLRKEMYIEKLNAMVNYCEQDTLCRSRKLLAYFNEQNILDCGKCDVCIEVKKRLPSEQEILAFEAELKTYLQPEGKTLQQITQHFANRKPNEIAQILRILMDNHKLQHNQNLLLTWNNQNA
jgi:ATP-dependent DNA helicase RecQ